ncbi:MAG: redoxin domain-containing protein [Actinomycetota bacterium]|nr:redoxin domain-containing protein [Actinomycetota bacterium]MEC8118268.1 redoxin domain-containing protein [Actinomycetota bacterium]MEC8335070.1 redoxin domain-containing protein [Actinomycetota bacterium]
MSLGKSGLILFAIVSIGFVVLLATRGSQSNQPNFDLVGQPAPLFQAETVTGGEFDLEDVLIANRALIPRDQVWVAVNFFASWCTGCIIEHDELLAFHNEGAFSSNGVKCNTKLVSVAFNDNKKDIDRFFDKYGGDWPVLLDEGTNRVAINYSVMTAPETVLIAPNGLVAKKIVGPITYEKLVAGIEC